jgi:hypothetical protein
VTVEEAKQRHQALMELTEQKRAEIYALMNEIHALLPETNLTLIARDSEIPMPSAAIAVFTKDDIRKVVFALIKTVTGEAQVDHFDPSQKGFAE